MPAVERGLLAHQNHMTVTVERHHHSPVDVRVLETQISGDHYARKILLARQSDGAVVQFGIVRLNFSHVDADVRREVESQKTPLGRVLIAHNVYRKIHLVRLWRIEPGPDLVGLFGLSAHKPSTAARPSSTATASRPSSCWRSWPPPEVAIPGELDGLVGPATAGVLGGRPIGRHRPGVPSLGWPKPQRSDALRGFCPAGLGGVWRLETARRGTDRAAATGSAAGREEPGESRRFLSRGVAARLTIQVHLLTVARRSIGTAMLGGKRQCLCFFVDVCFAPRKGSCDVEEDLRR